MTVTVGTTNNAAAGDKVTVRLVGSNNPGITTFGVQLGYNEDYLSYDGTYTWSSAVTSNGIQMVTSATENNSPVVNISAVFSNTYSNNETIVTLNFTVKRAYTDMSTYLTPTSREVTNSGMSNVTINWVYDPNAGLTSGSQNLLPDSENPSQSTGSTGTTTGGTTGSTTGGTTGSTTGGTTGSGTGSDTTGSVNDGTGSTGSNVTNNYYYNTKTTTNTTKNGVDNTPKTGAVDLRVILVMVIAAFLAIAGICLRVLGHRNRIR
jgi:hypothetical protein